MNGSNNPFPGLRPFEPHESALYFGRDDQIDELLERLAPSTDSDPKAGPS